MYELASAIRESLTSDELDALRAVHKGLERDWSSAGGKLAITSLMNLRLVELNDDLPKLTELGKLVTFAGKQS